MKNVENTTTYRKFTNPLTLIEQAVQARNVYYDSIGQSFESTSRDHRHAQPRIAFGAALSKHIGDSLTGDVLDKDRTTIIHYKKTHAANLVNWDGYAAFFETAEYILDSYFEGLGKIERIQYIDKMIKQLLTEKLLIQNSINEQLQIQDH